MNKFKLAWLILVTALLVGCSAEGRTPQSTQAEPTYDLPYEIIRDDDGYYLLLEDGIEVNDEMEGSLSIDGSKIIFGSMEEMVQDIKTGNFTEEELQELSKFEKDENDRIVLCDLSKLFDVYAPEEFSKKTITWFGDAYKFELCSSERELICYVFEGFSNAVKEEKIDNLITCREIVNFTLLSTEQIEDRNATVITYTAKNYELIKEGKRVFYTIVDGEKEQFVCEEYSLSTDEVPDTVWIYGTENGRNYCVAVINNQSRPSVEWLSQFGVREYVETEVA